MSHFQVFQVLPHLPEPLAFLEVLSRNIWWSWQHEAIGLFRRIDPRLWKESGRNPIAFLNNIPQKRMEGLAVVRKLYATIVKTDGFFVASWATAIIIGLLLCLIVNRA